MRATMRATSTTARWTALAIAATVGVLAAVRATAADADRVQAADADRVPAVAADNLFPFVVSYDSPANATNLSGWLARPAGRFGFVRVENGRFATDAGPIRFWGTNLCFEGCFPGKQEAERLARRLARLGINCVRMHHMDSQSIWGRSPNKLTIDPEKLDRLDYLVFQLKQHGVYTDLNLHVSRWFDAAEGFPARSERPEFDKGLDHFEPRMIELQKKYARDLLLHENPYTKTRYAEEPAIAMVEINNENAVYASWSSGNLDTLPEPYAATYRKLWNAWLAKKYGDSKRLREAWSVGAEALGEEMLANGDFRRPWREGWSIERDAQTDADVDVVDRAGGPGSIDPQRALRLVVRRNGEVAWRPQLVQSGLVVKKGATYTLTFRARADQPRRIGVNCMMAHAPWERLGFDSQVHLSTSWKPHRLAFVADRDDPNARITWTGFVPGTYQLADVSLRPGGLVGLEPGEGLQQQSVAVLPHGRMDRTVAARNDFCDFLWDLESRYWGGMYRYLKTELRVRPPVSGTQMGYGPAHPQAQLDYIDAHAYWQHPAFPGRPWDANDWFVRNLAMVNDPPGALGRLAATRIAGKPYTVSEYNHAAPIAYAAEGFPMIAAFGAFQQWDGIFSFAYSHNDRFELQRLDGFFDIKGDPTRLVHMPACVAMFVRGDVAPAKQTLVAEMSRQAERRMLHQTRTAWTLHAGSFGVEEIRALEHAIALELRDDVKQSAAVTPSRAKPQAEGRSARTPAVYTSDTGQIRWDAARNNAGCFLVDTPRSKWLTGFLPGRTFDLHGVAVSVGRTRLDWATVSIVAVDGQTLDRPGRILIAATGWVQNRDWRQETLGDNRVTLRSRWGTEPTLCEGVPAQIVLPVAPDRATLYPLDASGNRREPVAVADREGKTLVRLAPEHKTLWYEVEVR